ncbi:MAG: CHRD domain-containing protein [Phycisphaerales bacterium]|nr:CHRD domain-containing protein [Phycisphaerales bacterium]
MFKPAFTASLAVAALASVASADLFTWNITMDGPSESPPNASPATGNATITWDSVTRLLTIDLNFLGLIGSSTAAHIHASTPTPFAGTADVATQTPYFAGFPTGVFTDVYTGSLDLTQTASFSTSYVAANGGTAAGAAAALIAAMNSGQAYLNIHSTVFPGGEIRGFIPAPGAAAALALAGLTATRRRR